MLVSLGEHFPGAQTGRSHVTSLACARHPRSALPGGASARLNSLQMEGLEFCRGRACAGCCPGCHPVGPSPCPVMTSPRQPRNKPSTSHLSQRASCSRKKERVHVCACVCVHGCFLFCTLPLPGLQNSYPVHFFIPLV